MTQALRYILLGATCASLVALWSPPWYLTLIAFWCGVMFGLASSLIVHLWDTTHE